MIYSQIGNILKPMANVTNLKNHKELKKVKIYVEHLEAILKVMNLSIQGLTHFEVYIPVYQSLSTLREQKRILESHLNKYQQMLKDNK